MDGRGGLGAQPGKVDRARGICRFSRFFLFRHPKTTDFAMCFISMSQARQRVVDYSLVQYDQLSYISLAPGLASRQWIILSPFKVDVWLYSVTSSIMLAIFMFFIYKREARWKPSTVAETISDARGTKWKPSTMAEVVSDVRQAKWKHSTVAASDAREAKWGTIVINFYATFMKQRKQKKDRS